jgi:hypothetical protein
MSAVPRCHVVYALLICSLVSASGFAAMIEQPGGERALAGASNQKHDVTPGAASARRNLTPARGGALRGATGNVAKPAITAARPDLSQRSDVAARPRGLAAASSGLSAARRSVAGIKPLAAGNGAIGGPRTAARGMLGGAVNGNRVLKASIDGNALRRRF